MDPVTLFPFADYWWFYAAFLVMVCAVLALDLGVFHREAHEVGFKEALGWSVFWVGFALMFGLCFYWYAEWKFPRDPRILAYLAHAELTAGEIAARFDLSKPAISQHLAVLENAGLVTSERRGTWAWYAARPQQLDALRAALG